MGVGVRGVIRINRRVLYAIFGSELIFLGLVVLLFTHVVSRGPWYWVVLVVIALSAWTGVALSRRLFPKPPRAKDRDDSGHA